MKDNLTCLIIDDDCDIQSFLRIFFQRKGIRTYHSLTLKDALSKLTVNPDFILLDNHLPDGSGIDFIPQFRALCPNATLVAMTAVMPLQSKQEAFFKGADYFLEKPFTINQIHNLLNQVFQV